MADVEDPFSFLEIPPDDFSTTAAWFPNEAAGGQGDQLASFPLFTAPPHFSIVSQHHQYPHHHQQHQHAQPQQHPFRQSQSQPQPQPRLQSHPPPQPAVRSSRSTTPNDTMITTTNKDSRNAAERKRRADLTKNLHDLQQMVPSIANESKPTKAMIYHHAAKHFGRMQRENEHLERQEVLLRQGVEDLKAKVQQLELQLQTASTFDVSSGSSFSKADFDELLFEAQTSTGWIEVENSKGWCNVLMVRVPVASLPYPLVLSKKKFGHSTRTRAVTRVDSSPEALLTVLLDLPGRRAWDVSLLDVQSAGRIDGNTEVFYTAVESPGVVSNRDYVKMRTFRRLPNGTILVLERSTTHPKFPPKPGFVRGEIHMSGFVIQPLEGEEGASMVAWISEIDLKGFVPTVLMEQLSMVAPFQWFEAFINQSIDCYGSLVYCLRTALMRIALA